jgi:hypothetical protein
MTNFNHPLYGAHQANQDAYLLSPNWSPEAKDMTFGSFKIPALFSPTLSD